MPTKCLIVYFVISISLEAESFDTFLSKAVSQNYSLKSDNINIQKEVIRGDIATRWDNPQLEVELFHSHILVGIHILHRTSKPIINL